MVYRASFLWQDNFLDPKLGSTVEDCWQDYPSSRIYGEKAVSSFRLHFARLHKSGSFTAPAHCSHIDATWNAPGYLTCHPTAVLKGHGSPPALASHLKPLVASGIQLVIGVYKWATELNLESPSMFAVFLCHIAFSEWPDMLLQDTPLVQLFQDFSMSCLDILLKF